jgi:predicted NBD/HSP70 family sugar kinase
MKKVLGVDSSTQSVKVVSRDAHTGELLKSASRPHPEGTEVDPQHWFEALKDAIAEVVGLDSFDAISIAGQQHGMIVLDEKGEVIRPALLWSIQIFMSVLDQGWLLPLPLQSFDGCKKMSQRMQRKFAQLLCHTIGFRGSFLEVRI